MWVVPVYRHMYASKNDLADFEHRLRMCHLGLAGVAPHVRVLDTEQRVYEAAYKVRDCTRLVCAGLAARPWRPD